MRAFFVALAAAVALAATACGDAPSTLIEKSRSCGPHVQRCTAAEVGQPCDPNNLNVLCSAQANGSYCCLAYAH